MDKLLDLIKDTRNRIKVKFLADDRLWLVKVEQSKTAKRHKKKRPYSVNEVRHYLEQHSDKRELEISEEVVDIIKMKNTRYSIILLEALREHNLIST